MKLVDLIITTDFYGNGRIWPQALFILYNSDWFIKTELNNFHIYVWGFLS